MIVIENGRARSVRTPEETEQLLEADINRLSPAEREALNIVLREELQRQDRVSDEKSILELLGEAEYKTRPVDIETFVKDKYFLGETCGNTYPALMADLRELFDVGGYQEAIYTGAIGVGKTYVASIGICRILYEISCLKDPYAAFDIAKDSGIAIVALSVNEALATKVAFENIIVKLKSSPYFNENFPFEPTKKEYRFPHNITIAPRATTDTSVLGLNCISGFIDEASFLPSRKGVMGQEENKAQTIYAAIQRRMKSRFMRQGKLPGMMFIVSSKRTQDDFVAERIKQSLADPTVFVRDRSGWDLRPELYEGQKRFWVLCGTADIGSRILEEDEVERVRANMPDGAALIDVPTDFKLDFVRDLEGAIRDIGGISSVAIRPFIQRREKVRDAIDPSLKHPFSTLEYDMSKGGTFLWDRMVAVRTERAPGRVEFQRMKPVLHPGASRHAHIDLGLRHDAAGLCVGHVSGWKDVIRRTDDGRQYVEKAQEYTIDILLRIVPPIGGEIVFGEVRTLIYDLIAHGYTITSISADSWQSTDSFQQFAARGLNSQLISVDTSPDPYDTLKMALYEDRIKMYEYTPVIEELIRLEEDFTGRIRKIDHPKNFRKDTADALAGVVYTLSQQKLLQPIPIMKGIGYGNDMWMDEQRQSALAGNRQAGDNSSMPLPFLTGGGGSDDWGDGNGGWGNA